MLNLCVVAAHLVLTFRTYTVRRMYEAPGQKKEAVSDETASSLKKIERLLLHHYTLGVFAGAV